MGRLDERREGGRLDLQGLVYYPVKLGTKIILSTLKAAHFFQSDKATRQVGQPYTPSGDYYDELAHVNAVYNEFFAYPEFLEKGKVLNDSLPAPKVPGVVWSGLGLPERALIRTFALGRDTAEIVEIMPFPGVPVRLLAPPSGQTYIVERSGKVRTVD